MKRLNNKGITTIEVLVCFVLVVIITVSMYATVSSFNRRRILEQYKEELVSYKNLLTKEIQDDFIKIGLVAAKYKRDVVNEGSGKGRVTYTVNCDLKDGSKRILRITQHLAKSSYHPNGTPNIDDYFMIEYGKKEDDLMEYPIPDLGSYEDEAGHVIKDLSINNIYIDITQYNVLSIYIGFYHPELTTRYGISITCPINYIASGSDGTTGFSFGS